tara:strand:+ start:1089 stop:1856 length:768 start_codon:yes stop_codon:yes gene_type:complete
MELMFQLYILSFYERTSCSITNIETPKQLPTENNRSGWIQCKCGKRCTSLTPCFKMYVNITNGNHHAMILQNPSAYENHGSSCTFRKTKCDHQIWDLEDTMNQYIEKMIYYETIRNTSKSIVCYTDDKETAFLEKDISKSHIIIISFTTSILFIIIIGNIYHSKFGKKNTCKNRIVPLYNQLTIKCKNKVNKLVTKSIDNKQDTKSIDNKALNSKPDNHKVFDKVFDIESNGAIEPMDNNKECNNTHEKYIDSVV